MIARAPPEVFDRRFSTEPANTTDLPDPTTAAPPDFADLLVRGFPRAWRVARRMGLDPGHAEEVAQEAFVVFLQKQEKVELGKEDAFILSTTVRLCQNLRRKSYRFHEQLVSLEDLESHSDEVSTQQLMEQKQAREVIDGILCRMSDPLRMVFVLHELEQLTLQEIAEFLEIPTGTACSRLRLARAAFAKELELQNQANLATLEAP